MADTPNIGAPLWAASEATPWLMAGKRARMFDAFCVAVIVQEMDRTSPPGSCNDGDRYLVKSPGGGDWAGHSGELAIAVGDDAVNGWYFATVAVEGTLLWNRETDLNYRYQSGDWQEFSDAISHLSDLLDVDTTGLLDGYSLHWDASNQLWYAAPDIGQEWTPNWTDDGSLYIAAKEAMTIVGGVPPIGTGTISFAKSTYAAPDTFNSTSLPVDLEKGAWLKITASGVSDHLAMHLYRVL